MTDSDAVLDVDSVTDLLILDPASPDAVRWSPLLVAGTSAGDSYPLFAAGAQGGQSVEKVSLWRHDGGELPYARPASAELILLLEGRVEITPDNGSAREIARGNIAFVPLGFVGTWHTTEPVLKMSVSLVPADGH